MSPAGFARPGDPAGPDEPPATGEAEPRARRQITSEFDRLPGDLARGRGGRRYPPLRGGLVKFAHDDPAAAARLLAGLARGLRAVSPEPVRADLVLTELDTTLALDLPGDEATATTVQEREHPRPRRQVDADLRTDAVTLAEAVAGVEHRVRRWGPFKATRGRRRTRTLLAAAATGETTLPALVGAGARLEPRLALRALAYAVPRSWTRGHAFTAAITVDGACTTLRVRDGQGVDVNGDVDAPDATLSLSAEAFAGLLTGAADLPPAAVDDPALATLRDWAIRLGALPG